MVDQRLTDLGDVLSCGSRVKIAVLNGEIKMAHLLDILSNKLLVNYLNSG